MLPQRIEQLKQAYTDQYVAIDGDRPELARFKGRIGRVKTVNMSGRALVQFEADGDLSWYDVELDYVKVVDKPEPKPPPAKPKAAAAAKPDAKKPETPREPKPSPLELARMEKDEQKDKAEAGTSDADKPDAGAPDADKPEAAQASDGPAGETTPARPDTP